jgi:coenzyme F420-reducing hydrogenase gamma subunit
MTRSSRPVVGIFGLTGCAGDQLQILNCEDQLVEIAGEMEIAHWVMAQSENDRACDLDVGFVEGVVATERDLATLRKVRERSRFLVAIGTCAVWGGLPAMRNDMPREVLQREVYRSGGEFLDTVEARPATDFVPFDFCLPGCPMERHEFLRLVRAILAGTTPELTTKPVCHECKTRENLCPRHLLQGDVLRRHDPLRVWGPLPVPRRALRWVPGPGGRTQLRRQHRHVLGSRHRPRGDRTSHGQVLGAGLDDPRSRAGGGS